MLEQQLGQHGGLRVGLGRPAFRRFGTRLLLAQRIGTAHIATPDLEVGRGQREMGGRPNRRFCRVLGF